MKTADFRGDAEIVDCGLAAVDIGLDDVGIFLYIIPAACCQKFRFLRKASQLAMITQAFRARLMG